MASHRLLLASGSPRRKELLHSLGIDFDIANADVDETALPLETPVHLVKRLSHLKAISIAKTRPQDLVIGADTIVVADGKILGKPKNIEEASEFLQLLQGKSHIVYTGVSLVRFCNKLEDVRVSSTEVFFRSMSKNQIREYILTGEPMDKAGAYGIQGLGATLVEKIVGDYFTVVGLPLALLSDMLQKAGMDLLKQSSKSLELKAGNAH